MFAWVETAAKPSVEWSSEAKSEGGLLVVEMFLPVNPFARPGEFAHPPGGAVSYPSPHIAGPGPPLVLAPQFAAAGIAPLLDREPVDVCKLFVGGLSPSTTDADLEEHFKQFGRVRRKTPRSCCPLTAFREV